MAEFWVRHVREVFILNRVNTFEATVRKGLSRGFQARILLSKLPTAVLAFLTF